MTTGWVHHYVSTACLHEINDGDPDQHARCRATCKTCDRPCECANHTEDELAAAPSSWVDQARAIARDLYDRVPYLPKDLATRIASDPHLFWLRGEEQPPGEWRPPGEDQQ